MKYAPNIWTVEQPSSWLKTHHVQTCISGDRWVPARPLGFYSIWNRLKAAWLVFRGRADALTWEEQ